MTTFSWSWIPAKPFFIERCCAAKAIRSGNEAEFAPIGSCVYHSHNMNGVLFSSHTVSDLDFPRTCAVYMDLLKRIFLTLWWSLRHFAVIGLAYDLVSLALVARFHIRFDLRT